MSNENCDRLIRTMIESTRYYHLDMRLGSQKLDIVIFSKREDSSLIYRSIELVPDESGSILKSLEDAVYDNPLLLCEFEQVNVIVDTPRFAIVPTELADDDGFAGYEILSLTAGEAPDEEEVTVIDRVNKPDCAIVMGMAKKTMTFLNRAFNNPRVMHHLSPLLRFFRDRNRYGNSSGMFVNMRDSSLDAIVFNRDNLVMANTVDFRTPEDAVYHLLAIRKALDIDGDNDELLVSGERDIRLKVINRLREFVPYVMPVIFPSEMFRAGRASLDAPFDLIVISLCE